MRIAGRLNTGGRQHKYIFIWVEETFGFRVE